MQITFRFDQAKDAVSFVFAHPSSLDPHQAKTVEQKLDEAKKIYDFLIGKSHHFKVD